MDEELLAVAQAASSVIGVDFSQYREPMIRRRIEHRMHLRRCEGISAYAALLARDPGERWRLADAFLIKTTIAFRDQRTWATMRQVVLPKLIARCVRHDSHALCAWVAGCATGEEAYSYAMAMLDARDRAGVELDVRVVATDVDIGAIEHAARGTYLASAFANTPSELSQRYLRDAGDGKVSVSDALRDVVRLVRDSLTTVEPTPLPTGVFASFDLVSCCNVLLYFNDKARRAAFARLLSSCEPGSVIVLGEAESPPTEFQRRLLCVAPATHAFEVVQ